MSVLILCPIILEWVKASILDILMRLKNELYLFVRSLASCEKWCFNTHCYIRPSSCVQVAKGCVLSEKCGTYDVATFQPFSGPFCILPFGRVLVEQNESLENAVVDRSRTLKEVDIWNAKFDTNFSTLGSLWKLCCFFLLLLLQERHAAWLCGRNVKFKDVE